ncbi:Protein CBR-LPL-1 [Caenorhabditis briggsae]|uniref:lipoyl(octanoyl) transferase n=1 Tax=Caenorhabditis briggsae TaxID=6238 RepID=A8Y0J4_CAEBR|nr:Protein CBR-LPL-1 [Caenorhabditis briggsae]CAP38412.2 Protein CBR-LPL-1 [Caenorhabditis briggsae]
MLRNLFATARRFASSDSPRKVVVCSNGTIAAWHPPQEFPYEHTKPIDLSSKTDQTSSSRLSAAARASVIPREPVNAELKEIFYTSKHEWYSRYENFQNSKIFLFFRTREERLRNVAAPNFILALEHQPVYTVGIRSKGYTKEEEERLKALGAEFYRTSRGGLITFHGPGQLVLYPICDVRRVSTKQLGVRSFVDKLEQTIIDSATDGFGIHNVGRTENTGVWVNGERKLAAIGIAVSGGVSYHGIAINCNTDLTWFDNIVGCGIEGVSTTSLSLETRRNISVSEARPILLNSFANNFECLLS